LVLLIAVPFWAIVTLTASLPLWLNLLTTRRRCPKDRVCKSCGYNLTGNTSGVCPECGTTIKKNPSPLPARKSRA